MYCRNGLYRYWIIPDDGTVKSSVVNTRKMNPETGSASTPGDHEVLVGDESVGSMVKRKLDIIDARKRPELSDPDRARYKQHEVDNYTDIGYVDGVPYQGDAVIIIMIPYTRLKVLAQQIHSQSVSSQDAPAEIRSIIYSNYVQTYSETGLLNFDTLVATYGWSTTERNQAADYVHYIDDCYQIAKETIRKIVKKYVAFGVLPIIMYKDE